MLQWKFIGMIRERYLASTISCTLSCSIFYGHSGSTASVREAWQDKKNWFGFSRFSKTLFVALFRKRHDGKQISVDSVCDLYLHSILYNSSRFTDGLVVVWKCNVSHPVEYENLIIPPIHTLLYREYFKCQNDIWKRKDITQTSVINRKGNSLSLQAMAYIVLNVQGFSVSFTLGQSPSICKRMVMCVGYVLRATRSGSQLTSLF